MHLSAQTAHASPADLRPDLPAPEDAAVQAALCAAGPVPQHVAIIMDGNGRWAQDRGQDRVFGHYEGVRSVRDVTEAAVQIGIEHLTLYTFSTENWGRPQAEVEGLMTLLVDTVGRERETLLRNGVRLALLGDVEALPPAPRAGLQALMDETAALSRMTLHLALSYSGRWEITEAARRIAQDVAAGTLAPDAVDEAAVAARMATADAPAPDLLVRTGGETRISNFLLWSLAYTELYFTPCLWPDFRRAQLYDAVRSFQTRDRRFGRLRA